MTLMARTQIMAAAGPKAGAAAVMLGTARRRLLHRLSKGMLRSTACSTRRLPSGSATPR